MEENRRQGQMSRNIGSHTHTHTDTHVYIASAIDTDDIIAFFPFVPPRQCPFTVRSLRTRVAVVVLVFYSRVIYIYILGSRLSSIGRIFVFRVRYPIIIYVYSSV